MVDSATIFVCALILFGAGVMVANIYRFRKTAVVLERFDASEARYLRRLVRVHLSLMAFFVVGYLAVAWGILARVAFISSFFVGLIFFLGAVFVWLGILIQHRMIAMIRSRYEQAHQAKADLEEERSRLVDANQRLNTEVGERRRVENALRESEQRLKLIIDRLPAGVLIIEEASKIIKEANPAALHLIGVDKARVIGERCHRYVCPAEENRCPITDLGKPFDQYERILLNAGGKRIPILKSVCRITLDGQAHLLESFIDLSDKERLEAQLQRAQKMEALGTLAGGVAHDLNNILSGIISYPELLLRDLPEDSPMRRPIETIKKSGEKAATIVQDMLTLARRGLADKAVVNLRAVIRDYLDSPEHRRLAIHHPEVVFENKIADDLLNIEGSPVHLLKTVMNLASNAAEAMPDGGTAMLRAENRYMDHFTNEYDAVPEGEYVTLMMSDTGIGIADEDRDRIFEPFFTRKKMGRSGTGLGMAVVWGTVQDHGGHVHVDSTLMRGTTITLFFPATREEPVISSSSLDIDAFTGDGESVLIVDDVAEQREIATDMLKVLNYSVHAVSSGEAAVAYLRDHDADLVLLDMIMDPGMGGLQTYRRILDLHPGQRALLVSGYSETDDVREALRLGAGQYVRKPYALITIARAIRRVLAR